MGPYFASNISLLPFSQDRQAEEESPEEELPQNATAAPDLAVEPGKEGAKKESEGGNGDEMGQ